MVWILWPRVTHIFALECVYAYVKSEYLLNYQVLGLLWKVLTVVTAENYNERRGNVESITAN